ncbi:DUF6049 family protein [Gordonia sp. NPDC003376]
MADRPDRVVLRPIPALPLLAFRRLVVVCAVAMLTVLAASPAAAAPSGTPPASGSAGATPTASEAARFARIVIDSLTPTMVTSTSGPTVSVTGHVLNTSSRTIHELSIRLERGDAVSDADALRSSLAGEHPPVAAASAFRPIGSDDGLAPGAQVAFDLTVPLSGTGLEIDRTGVYPLQINVNGLPDYGGMAQVAGSRTLLPVLSLPPNRARAASYVDPSESGTTPVTGLGPDGSVSADTSDPSRLTLLWPVAAPPQLAPGVLGGNTEPVRLISEDLAASLSDGGRLKSLLDPLRAVADPPTGTGGSSSSPAPSPDSGTPDDSGAGSSESAPPAPVSAIARSMCLAVDPDLLVTVRAMSLGYVVTADPADPLSPTQPGTGQAAAAAWLDELRTVSSRMCVVALPFAAADLTSLHQIDDVGLTAAALDSPADIIDAILGVRSVRGLTIPALGAIDEQGASLLQSADHHAALTSADNVTPTRDASAAGGYRVGDLGVSTFDQPVTAAMAAVGTAPTTPTLTPADQQVDLSEESAVSRRQAAVGALAFGAIDVPSTPGSSTGSSPTGTASGAVPVTGRSQVILPSLYWSPTDDDTEALLSTATVLLGADAAAPRPFAEVATATADARTAAQLSTPAGFRSVASLSVPLTEATADTIRAQTDMSWRLQNSLVATAEVAVSPDRYMAPLREDLLRSITTPAQAGTATRDRLVRTRVVATDAVSTTLGRIRSAVTILDPGGRYTLASERSPLLLVVRNDLSLPIRVRITTDTSSDLEIGDLGTIEIPARGTRQIQMPTRADSSEAITVTISMDTVTGVQLGSPITLSVHSNAYGKPLFIVTIIAAVVLILLTARRLWHRFRGEPDPADEDRPEPDELERLLAATTYQQRRRTLQNEELSDEELLPGLPSEDPGTPSPGHPEPNPDSSPHT